MGKSSPTGDTSFKAIYKFNSTFHNKHEICTFYYIQYIYTSVQHDWSIQYVITVHVYILLLVNDEVEVIIKIELPS